MITIAVDCMGETTVCQLPCLLVPIFLRGIQTRTCCW